MIVFADCLFDLDLVPIVEATDHVPTTADQDPKKEENGK